jgi:hypothetical protein
MKRKLLYLVAGAGILYLLWPRKAAAAAPPAVAGTVTSGSQSVVIDTNVLSPTFGLPVPN